MVVPIKERYACRPSRPVKILVPTALLHKLALDSMFSYISDVLKVAIE